MTDVVIPQPGEAGTGRRSYRGELMLLAGALLFALNGAVSKVVLNAGLPPMRMTEIRSAGAFVVLAIWLLIRNPRSLRITKAQLPFLMIYGTAGFAAVQVFYFFTIGRLPVGIGLLFEFTAAVWLVLWARFVQKEVVKRRFYIAVVLSLIGLSLVANVFTGVKLDTLGVAFGIIASFSLALYYLLGQHGVRQRDSISLVTYGFLFATIFWFIVQPVWSFPTDVLTQDLPIGGSLSDAMLPGWILVAYIVVLGTVAPFLLVIGALKHTSPARAGMIGMMEPVSASVVTWFWLGETLTLSQVFGGVIVLIAIGLAETAR